MGDARVVVFGRRAEHEPRLFQTQLGLSERDRAQCELRSGHFEEYGPLSRELQIVLHECQIECGASFREELRVGFGVERFGRAALPEHVSSLARQASPTLLHHEGVRVERDQRVQPTLRIASATEAQQGVDDQEARRDRARVAVDRSAPIVERVVEATLAERARAALGEDHGRVVSRIHSAVERCIRLLVIAPAAQRADAGPDRAALRVADRGLEVGGFGLRHVTVGFEADPARVPGVARRGDVAAFPALSAIGAFDTGRTERGAAGQQYEAAERREDAVPDSGDLLHPRLARQLWNVSRKRSFSSRVPMVTRKQWARRPPRL